MSENEATALMALQNFPGIGYVLARRLIQTFGSAEAVFSANISALSSIPGIGPVLAKKIATFSDQHFYFQIQSECKQKGYDILCYNEPGFPQKLKEIPDGPLCIFRKGNADINPPKAISIVGTRRATPYGIAQTRALVRSLKNAGAVIISGLALGIDAAAHDEALNQDIPTFAVLAHGLNYLYPYVHRKMAQNIQQNGALITEQTPQTKPDKAHFPMRNRIIAGLCDAVVVVESAIRGGAMITARLACDYDRDVYAIPGRTTDPMSKGCLELISTQIAQILPEPEALPELLGWNKPVQQKIPFPFPENSEEYRILSFLREAGPVPADEISEKLCLSYAACSAAITRLEMEGMLNRMPGNRITAY